MYISEQHTLLNLGNVGAWTPMTHYETIWMLSPDV